MGQTFEQIWLNWNEMLLREQVARALCWFDFKTPRGINALTKRVVDENYQKHLDLADIVIAMVRS